MDIEHARTNSSTSPERRPELMLPGLLGKRTGMSAEEGKLSEAASTPPPLPSGNSSPQEPPASGYGRCLARCVVAVSSCDLIASMVLTVFAFTYAYRNDGVSLYCMGIQAMSHLTSSVVLVLRFSLNLSPPRGEDVAGTDVLQNQRRRDFRREQLLVIVMAIALMFSCIACLFKALQKIRLWNVWYLDHAHMDAETHKASDIIAWWGFSAYVLQALVRGAFACQVRVSIAWHAFSVSTISLLFFFVLGLAADYQREWSWKAEPIAAMVLVVVMMCESIGMVLTNIGSIEAKLERYARI